MRRLIGWGLVALQSTGFSANVVDLSAESQLILFNHEERMKHKLRFLASVASLIVLTACGSGSGNKPASLRAVHAAVDAPAVRLSISGNEIATLNYKQASAYIQRDAGSNPISTTVASSGASIASLSPDLILTNDKRYTLIAAGRLADSTLTPITLVDEGDAPATSQVKLRVAHVAPSVGAVDIYITAPTIDIATTATSLSLSYKDVLPAAGAKAIQVPGGDYRIRITLAGTKTIAFDSGTLSLSGGADLQILAIPSNAVAGKSPVSLLALTADNLVIEINDIRNVTASPLQAAH
jgi:hypothetical protein